MAKTFNAFGGGTPLPAPLPAPPMHSGADAVDTVRERVLAEAVRFREQLRSLMVGYADRWVVFHHGAIASVHDSEDDAYVAGLRSFGPDGGYLVAEVKEPEIVDVDSLFS